MNSINERFYNALSSVAEADYHLGQLGGEEVVGQVLGVITDAGLEGHIGLRLLHRHNDLFPGEVMVERSVVDRDGFALVTGPVDANCSGRIACNSWQLSESTFVPSEYSCPEVVSDPNLVFADYQPVFNRLATALKDFRVATVLGPCLNYSDLVLSYRPGPEAKLLETIDEDNRSNIVRYVGCDDAGLVDGVKTKWFAEPIVNGKGKLVWAAKCKLVCSIIPETGKHQGTKVHVPA